MTDCRGFGRCAGLGSVDAVCQGPRDGNGLPAPIAEGPLGKALQLGMWVPVDGLLRGRNMTGPGPLSFSWAHVDASPKLTVQRTGFTWQVLVALRSRGFDPNNRVPLQRLAAFCSAIGSINHDKQ